MCLPPCHCLIGCSSFFIKVDYRWFISMYCIAVDRCFKLPIVFLSPSLQNVRLPLDGLPLGDILNVFAISKKKLITAWRSAVKKTVVESILLPVVKQKWSLTQGKLVFRRKTNFGTKCTFVWSILSKCPCQSTYQSTDRHWDTTAPK